MRYTFRPRQHSRSFGAPRIALAAAVVCAAFGAPAADAADGYRPVLAFSSWPGGELGFTLGVAVDAAGRVHAVDYAGSRIVRFDSSGAFIDSIGTPGDGAGQLAYPVGVAVDPATGLVSVLESQNARIAQFDATGAFVRAFGWGVVDGQQAFQICTTTCRAGIGGSGAGQLPSFALASPTVEPATGELYVPDPGGDRVQVFSAAGDYLRTITGSGAGVLDGPNAVAFGSDGDLYVATEAGSRIVVLEPTGDFVSVFGAGLLTAADNALFALPGLAFGPGGSLFAVQPTGIVELDPTGTAIVSEIPSLTPGAVAFDSASGMLYVCDPFKSRVLIEAFGPLPDAVAVPATSVTPTTATLNGTVNPRGNETKAYFEYGPDTTYGSRLPETDVDVGSDSTDHPLSADVTGLEGLATYHYRVVTTVLGRFVYGEDQTFTTTSPPGTLLSGGISGLTPTSVRVHATLNPHGAPTSYYVEYGVDTTYGRRVPQTDVALGSDSSDHAVSEVLTGLDPNTTYHVRFVMTNGGVRVRGVDQAFSTILAPTAATGHAVEVTASEARLTAVVHPNGGETRYRVEYGTDDAYGAFAPLAGDAVLPSVVHQRSVAQGVAGLRPATTYHFRVVATNEVGTARGLDETFTTLPEPPVVATGRASSVTSTAATLGATVNPRGGATRYRFEYWTGARARAASEDVSLTARSGERVVSAAVSGLLPATTYHYRVVASNAGGTAEGAERSFTTAAGTGRGRVAIGRSARVARGEALLAVACRGGGPCEATVRLTAVRRIAGVRWTVRLGAARVELQAGRERTVRLKLSPAGRRLVAGSAGPLIANATVVQRGRSVVSRRVALRRNPGARK